MWSSSSQPSCTPQQPLLGGGVAPLICCPSPWACGMSSQPPPLTTDMGKLLSATAPALSQPGSLSRYSDLGRGVAPHSHASVRSVAASALLEKMLGMILIFLNLPRLDLWPRMWSILEKVLCALEKKVKFIVLG